MPFYGFCGLGHFSEAPGGTGLSHIKRITMGARIEIEIGAVKVQPIQIEGLRPDWTLG